VASGPAVNAERKNLSEEEMRIYRNSYFDSRKQTHKGFTFHTTLADANAQFQNAANGIIITTEIFDFPTIKQGLMEALRQCAAHAKNS
jgi:hypothetical protein